MKDYCLELASRETESDSKRNIMREYLQAYILRIMQDKGAFRSIAFLGGTALRFLYGLPRFSEDLDFSLTKKEEYDFARLMGEIKAELAAAGYDISVTYNDEKNVHSAFVKFNGLMYAAGISSLKSQKFSIKIEVDINPPAGAVLKTDIVNKFFPFSFLSYDIPSLFAGKLHALLSRKYTKGRDLFDLGWYLSRWKDVTPNIVLLSNALKQTGWRKGLLSKDNWRNFLYKAVKDVDWNKAREEVGSFLEHPSDLNVFSKENILVLIRSNTNNN